MIAPPSGARIWLAASGETLVSPHVTDMRKGMNGLALQVQQALGRDPHAGDLYVFRGRRADLVEVLWHDEPGMSLYAKRLERGRFVWPQAQGGAVALTHRLRRSHGVMSAKADRAALAMLLEGIDWRHPQRTWRPEAAG